MRLSDGAGRFPEKLSMEGKSCMSPRVVTPVRYGSGATPRRLHMNVVSQPSTCERRKVSSDHGRLTDSIWIVDEGDTCISGIETTNILIPPMWSHAYPVSMTLNFFGIEETSTTSNTNSVPDQEVEWLASVLSPFCSAKGKARRSARTKRMTIRFLSGALTKCRNALHQLSNCFFAEGRTDAAALGTGIAVNSCFICCTVSAKWYIANGVASWLTGNWSVASDKDVKNGFMAGWSGISFTSATPLPQNVPMSA